MSNSTHAKFLGIVRNLLDLRAETPTRVVPVEVPSNVAHFAEEVNRSMQHLHERVSMIEEALFALAEQLERDERRRARGEE